METLPARTRTDAMTAKLAKPLYCMYVTLTLDSNSQKLANRSVTTTFTKDAGLAYIHVHVHVPVPYVAIVMAQYKYKHANASEALQ